MEDNDRKDFAHQLANVWSVYAHAPVLTQTAIQAFWGVLEAYPLDAVIGALNYHLGDHTGRGAYIPAPADIKKILDVTFPQIIKQRAARIITIAREKCAPANERIAIAMVERNLGLIGEAEMAERQRVAHNEIGEIMTTEPVKQAFRVHKDDRRPSWVQKVAKEPTPVRTALKNAMARFFK